MNREDFIFLCYACCASNNTVLRALMMRQPIHAQVGMQGDNNPGNDRLLYVRGRQWLQKEHIVGRAVGFLPGVGMVTIVMNDYPWLKYSVIGLLGILCLLGIDE